MFLLLSVAIYCGPSVVYLTDIHDPTLNNAAHNARLNVSNTLSQNDQKNEGDDDEGCMTIKMTSKADEKYIEEVIIFQSNSENVEDPSSSMELESMNISDDTNTKNTNIDNTIFKAPFISTESVKTNCNNCISHDGSESTILRVSKVSWSDPKTFPPKADILIGSDLVYDSKILTLLTQAVDGMLASGDIYTFSSNLFIFHFLHLSIDELVFLSNYFFCVYLPTEFNVLFIYIFIYLFIYLFTYLLI